MAWLRKEMRDSRTHAAFDMRWPPDRICAAKNRIEGAYPWGVGLLS